MHDMRQQLVLSADQDRIRIQKLKPLSPPVNNRDWRLEGSTPVPNSNNGGLWPASKASDPPTAPPSSSPARRDDEIGLDQPRKRVKFTGPDTDLTLALLKAQMDVPLSSDPRYPCSSQEGSSMKSILKPFNRQALPESQTDTSDNDAQDSCRRDEATDSNFATLLRTTIAELSTESRDGRIEVYLAIMNALKAHDLTVVQAETTQLLSKVIRFILRDIRTKMANSQEIDVELSQHAAKLLSVLVWAPVIARRLTASTYRNIADSIAEALQPQSMAPKLLVNHLLHIVARSESLMTSLTPERSRKLLQAVSGLTPRIKGNSIIGERLAVYIQLLHQFPQVMERAPEKWVMHMFSAMLSSIKEIRNRAIAFGTKAGLRLGASLLASRTVLDVFDRGLHDQDVSTNKFIDFFLDRITQMSANEEESEHVPQIWALIVLFFQNRHHLFHHWKHFDLWREVLQKSFNSSSIGVVYQANIAWNRLVFAIDPMESTPRELIKLLRTPIIGQLERRSNDRKVTECRKFAVMSTCNLLYYAFRPTSSWRQLDIYWDAYMVPIVQNLLISNRKDTKFGCRILCAFLAKEPAPWDSNRANETSKWIGPSELPTLDPKWVRSRSAKILDTIAKAVRTASWVRSDGGAPLVKQVWSNFLGKLAEASSKDVIASLDTKTTFYLIGDILCSIWKEGPESLVRPQEKVVDINSLFFERFQFLLSSAMTVFDNLPLLELTSHERVDAGLQGDETAPMLISVFWHVLESPERLKLASGFEKLLACLISHDHGVTDSRLGTSVDVYLEFFRCYQIFRDLQDPDKQKGVVEIGMTLIIWDIIARNLTSLLTCPQSIRGNGLDVVNPEQLLKIVNMLRWRLNLERTARLDTSEWNNLHSALSKIVDPIDNRKLFRDLGQLAADHAREHGISREPLMLAKETVESRISIGTTALETSSAPLRTPEPLPVESPKRPMSKGRKRHDDSQIEFTAIDQIPAVAAAMESQLMTSRQKEIKERQQNGLSKMLVDNRLISPEENAPRSTDDHRIESSPFCSHQASLQNSPSDRAVRLAGEASFADLPHTSRQASSHAHRPPFGNHQKLALSLKESVVAVDSGQGSNYHEKQQSNHQPTGKSPVLQLQIELAEQEQEVTEKIPPATGSLLVRSSCPSSSEANDASESHREERMENRPAQARLDGEENEEHASALTNLPSLCSQISDVDPSGKQVDVLEDLRKAFAHLKQSELEPHQQKSLRRLLVAELQQSIESDI